MGSPSCLTPSRSLDRDCCLKKKMRVKLQDCGVGFKSKWPVRVYTFVNQCNGSERPALSKDCSQEDKRPGSQGIVLALPSGTVPLRSVLLKEQHVIAGLLSNTSFFNSKDSESLYENNPSY